MMTKKEIFKEIEKFNNQKITKENCLQFNNYKEPLLLKHNTNLYVGERATLNEVNKRTSMALELAKEFNDGKAFISNDTINQGTIYIRYKEDDDTYIKRLNNRLVTLKQKLKSIKNNNNLTHFKKITHNSKLDTTYNVIESIIEIYEENIISSDDALNTLKLLYCNGTITLTSLLNYKYSEVVSTEYILNGLTPIENTFMSLYYNDDGNLSVGVIDKIHNIFEVENIDYSSDILSAFILLRPVLKYDILSLLNAWDTIWANNCNINNEIIKWCYEYEKIN